MVTAGLVEELDEDLELLLVLVEEEDFDDDDDRTDADIPPCGPDEYDMCGGDDEE